MNWLKNFLVLSFIALLLVSCAPQTTPATPPASTTPPASSSPSASSKPSETIEYTNAAQRITVPVGVTFIITVNANPTTGYTWEAGFDQSLLKLVKRYTPSKSGMLGAGGVESFDFQGMKSGETEIYLNYKRPFETNNPGMESKTFKVTIK